MSAEQTSNRERGTTVPAGMVANVPWHAPLARWADGQLRRGLAHCADESPSPRLAEAIRSEIHRRNGAA